MFLAAFLILVGLTGLAVCGVILMMRISEALGDCDYER